MNDEEKDPVATLVRMAGRRPQVGADRAGRVRAAVENEWRSGIRRRRVVRVGSMVAATAIAATIAGVLWLRPAPVATPAAPAAIVARVQSGVRAGEIVRAGDTIDIPQGAMTSLDWSGATLRADGGTRLKLDSISVATLERGAIYFADDAAQRGVTIRTPFGDVRDVGTRFEVRLVEDGLRVRVRDGLVSLRDVTATAGTELAATRDRIERRAIATSGDEWSWIERAAPPITLDGKTLEEVLEQVAVEKGLLLEWRTTRSRNARLHGNVPLSLDEVLDAATAASGTTVRIEANKLVVQ